MKIESVQNLEKNLVEVSKGNVHLSKFLAEMTGQKARYTKTVGFDNKYYSDLILKGIKEHGAMTRKEIDELLWNKLPDSLDDIQKKHRIMNLIANLRGDKMIFNYGTRSKSQWRLL